MLALTRAMGLGVGRAGGNPADATILPRPLRKPVRYLGRWFSGNVNPPRHAAALANGGLIAAALFYGVFAGGHAPTVVQASAAAVGFSIRDLAISGQNRTTEDEVAKALGLNSWTSLIGFDAEAARASLESLPWVASATVRKSYPSGLDIALVERRAAAIWQRDDALTLIDEEGKEIAEFDDPRFSGLPLVIGVGAERAARDFLPLIGGRRAIADRVVAHILIGERRWDLRLDNGVTVRLPEEAVGEALDTLARLETESGVLARDIDAIDLRLPDRVAFELTDSGAAARAEAVKIMIDAEKKRRRT
ncbi:MAG: cell division protein FtsQ/DivIB [Phyllobacteriaceae bacterium]|nr:cell division protein FtsQ/DivIB [Phyllobacteriaceae bacterium]